MNQNDLDITYKLYIYSNDNRGNDSSKCVAKSHYSIDNTSQLITNRAE